ncbi:MAG: thiol reductant ABC exporter subunit CydC [Christensenellales bacterium]|jgi:thiol reductant ABC exporter CydC subunit
MKRSGFKVMARLIGLVRPLIAIMLLAIAMGVLGHICASFITILGGYAILNALGIETALSIKTIAIILLLFAVARGLLRYGEQYANHLIAFKLLARLRDIVFDKLRKLAPAKLETKDKGDLIALITSDIELLEVFYAHTISPIAIAIIFSAIMIGFIGAIHWALGLIAFIAYAVVGVALPLFASKRSEDIGMRFRNQSGELSAYVLESLRGLSEIMQYGKGKERLEGIGERTSRLSKVEAKMKRTAGHNTAITNTVIFLFDIVMLLVSAKLVNFEGTLIASLALMSSFGPVVALSSLGTTLQNTFAAGNRVLDILDESPVVNDVKGKANVTFKGAEANNINFAYDEMPILKEISLKLPYNRIIGITGRSGSGKSTLLKLLMRFWNVDSGEILISGAPIDEINTDNLRDMQSYVTQETHLFRASIADNLRIAKWDASSDEIIEACKKASVHDFIMSLPNGYDTQVGELGDTLSGGERQRIDLARAFLHDAPMILLDEPTANLDSLNEAVILKSLQEARDGKTVVLVSHRQSTMGIADKTYCVEHGRIS